MVDQIKKQNKIFAQAAHTRSQLHSSSYLFEVLTGSKIQIAPTNNALQDKSKSEIHYEIVMSEEKYEEFLDHYINYMKFLTAIAEDHVAKDMFEQLVTYLTLKN